MSRLRDSKGIFIATKIPENLFGPRKTPPTNSVNRYAGKFSEEKVQKQ
jgi:hypothetical protein